MVFEMVKNPMAVKVQLFSSYIHIHRDFLRAKKKKKKKKTIKRDSFLFRDVYLLNIKISVSGKTNRIFPFVDHGNCL